MKLIKDVFIGSVSCGKHKANTCADCPQGKGANWCHGDCQWVNGRCQKNLLFRKIKPNISKGQLKLRLRPKGPSPRQLFFYFLR